jgi:hypothetical protein
MKPRPHHYGFAHCTLPRALLTEQVGGTWMSLLAGPAGPLLLRRVWQDVAAKLRAEHRLDDDGFAASVHQTTRDQVLVVLTLPPAVVELEAHLVAVVAQRESWSPRRYLTLEKGSNALTGAPATYIAALHPPRGRVAFGEGPKPDEAAFAAAVCGHLGLAIDLDRPPARYE